jgi:hypothetical protein
MRSPRTRWLILAAPVALSVAMAGPAAAADSKSDKAILKAGVVRKTDVPADWTSKPGTSGSGALKGLRECKRINTTVASANKDDPKARSREFADQVSQARSQAQNAVYAFQNKKAAGQFVSAFKGSTAMACFVRLGNEVLRNQPAAAPPTVAPITDLQGVGDEALGCEIAASYTQNGGVATLYIDYVAVRVGRAAMIFVFANVGGRITQGPDIVNATVQRVAAAKA